MNKDQCYWWTQVGYLGIVHVVDVADEKLGPLLMAFFLSPSDWVAFLQEGDIKGFWYFAWDPKSKIVISIREEVRFHW